MQMWMASGSSPYLPTSPRDLSPRLSFKTSGSLPESLASINRPRSWDRTCSSSSGSTGRNPQMVRCLEISMYQNVTHPLKWFGRCLEIIHRLVFELFGWRLVDVKPIRSSVLREIHGATPGHPSHHPSPGAAEGAAGGISLSILGMSGESDEPSWHLFFLDFICSIMQLMATDDVIQEESW